MITSKYGIKKPFVWLSYQNIKSIKNMLFMMLYSANTIIMFSILLFKIYLLFYILFILSYQDLNIIILNAIFSRKNYGSTVELNLKKLNPKYHLLISNINYETFRLILFSVTLLIFFIFFTMLKNPYNLSIPSKQQF
jgi:hypothetical protein